MKRWSKIDVANVTNKHMCNAYLHPANIDVSVKRLRYFFA